MEKQEKPAPKKRVKQSKFASVWKWPLTVLVMALTLSFSFGVLSQYALSGAGVVVSIVVIVVFIVIAIVTDMIGVAVTAAEISPFRAMAAKKVRGAKESIKLIENAEKVASVSADIIGDICSILSGAAGASVAAVFILTSTDQFVGVLIASAVSAIIAALTIFGKALGKKYAMNKGEKIVLILGKVASLFHSQKSLKKQAATDTKKSKKAKKQSSASEDKNAEHAVDEKHCDQQTGVAERLQEENNN
ncbi:MAG: hypothetical protein J6A28_01880 [Clostridia bacterium]|nr:hypothetical protein [Clostridia bacterium]